MSKPTQKLPMSRSFGTDSPRYAKVHDMVTELLARTDPGGYDVLLAELRAEWQPVGPDMHLVELMADAFHRMRGCAHLETEIMQRNIDQCAQAGERPEMALGKAFALDCEGPKLLDKLGGYRNRLQTGFSRCARILRERAKVRQLAEANDAAKLKQLKNLKSCTSVIQ